jgi:hypothetical protein
MNAGKHPRLDIRTLGLQADLDAFDGVSPFFENQDHVEGRTTTGTSKH